MNPLVLLLLLALSVCANLSLLSVALWQRERLRRCANEACPNLRDARCEGGHCTHHCLLQCGSNCAPWWRAANERQANEVMRWAKEA